MDLIAYRANKVAFAASLPVTRTVCYVCFQPAFNCYCAHVRRFDPGISFVILMHSIEARRRIATGRMSHLCLENSYLLRGENYSQDPVVNQLIAEPGNHCVVLYPGPQAKDLSLISRDERQALRPRDGKLVIFVIDGTWNTARKMIRSTNLIGLPRICFSPSKPSAFRVRKQPKPWCYSTLEAIHETIDLLLEPTATSRPHDNLLEVFEAMVEKQLEYVRRAYAQKLSSRHRRNPHAL